MVLTTQELHLILELRWKQHCEGDGAMYTREHKPTQIVFVKEFRDIFEAREREKQIKDWSQEKKKRLISREWE